MVKDYILRSSENYGKKCNFFLDGGWGSWIFLTFFFRNLLVHSWSIEDIQIGEKIYVLAIYFNLTTSSVLNTLFSPFLEHCMLWILIAIVLFVITRVCTMYLICDFCLFINTISKYGNVTIFYTEIMIRKVKLLSFYRHKY